MAALPVSLAALPWLSGPWLSGPWLAAPSPQLAWAAAFGCTAPFLLAACVSDVRRRIIPDWTVLALAAVGTGVALLGGALLPHLLAGLSCLALGALLAFFGLWGWGDAKLLGAAGLLVGPAGLAPMANVMVCAGAGLALILISLRGPVRAGRLPLPARAPRWLVAEHRRLRAAPSVPYGLAIAAGAFAGM